MNKFSFFTPTTKVHMQRDVMREADQRLVKYSKRGILLSFTVFCVCMWMGQFYYRHPQTVLVLAAGLLTITTGRAYFLFKFEQIYAQAPNRWRNLFFLISLIGSTWWGIILASVTYSVGLYYETPVLWLYTVAFFAGSIYVFAPFGRFLSLYMFVSFVPCAVVAVSSFDPTSVLYGLIMLVLYLLLVRQGRAIGNNYWERLQANYDLIQKANALEAEKISTESSLSHQDTLLTKLVDELKVSMQEILSGLKLVDTSTLSDENEKLLTLSEQKTQQQINLLQNMEELSEISNHDVKLDQHVFDIRRQIEHALNNVSIIAHSKNIEVYSSFSSDLPPRAKGDAERLEQIIGNLVTSACQYCESGELLLSCSFRYDREPGWLKISVINFNPQQTPEVVDSINSAFSPQYANNIGLGLGLSIVKGLAQCMGGNAGIDFKDNGALIFWASVRLWATNTISQKSKALVKLQDKRVLLYQPPKVISEVFTKTLEDTGLLVSILHKEDEAVTELEKAYSSGNPYHLIIIYTALDNVDGLSLSAIIAKNEKLWSTPQIVTLSKLQNKWESVEKHFSEFPKVQTLYKPIQFRQLHRVIRHLLVESKEEQDKKEKDFLDGKRILLFQQEEIDMVIIKRMLKKLGCQVYTASTMEESLTLLKTNPVDAFISESHLENILDTKEHFRAFIDEARESNFALRDDFYKMPVLGLSSHKKQGEETQCLASGMEYYIDSPTEIDDLKAVLRRFIGRSEHMADQESTSHSK